MEESPDKSAKIKMTSCSPLIDSFRFVSVNLFRSTVALMPTTNRLDDSGTIFGSIIVTMSLSEANYFEYNGNSSRK